MSISSGVKRQAAFWGLCVVAGSGWMLGLSNPPMSHRLLHLGFESALLAVLFGWLGRGRLAGLRWSGIAFWGAVLVLPAVLGAVAGVALSPITLALVFTLVPAITVLAAGQTAARFGWSDSPIGLLLPALAGVGGAALLLPFNLPQEAAGWLWLGAAVGSAILTGLALVRLQPLLGGVPLAGGAFAVCSGWAVVCLSLGWVGGVVSAPSVSRMLAFESEQTTLSALLVVLTVMLLRTWTAAQVSARYLAAPLITVLEGLVLLRPQVSWTLWVGVGTLGAAVAMLLRSGEADSSDSVPD